MVSCEWLISFEIYIFFCVQVIRSFDMVKHGKFKISSSIFLCSSLAFGVVKKQVNTRFFHARRMFSARGGRVIYGNSKLYMQEEAKKCNLKIEQNFISFFATFLSWIRIESNANQHTTTKLSSTCLINLKFPSSSCPHRYQKQKTQKKNMNCEKFNSTWRKFEQVAISISRAHYIPSHSAAALDDDKFNWIYVGKFSALSAAAKPDATRQATSAISMSF